MTRGVQKSSQVNGEKKRDVTYAEPGVSEYARITKMLGNGRVTVQNMDNVERLGIIRGNMRKREWMSVGDLVLVTLRGYQEDKVDIVFKYTESEVRMLRRWGEIKDESGDGENSNKEEDYVAFEADDDVDIHRI